MANRKVSKLPSTALIVPGDDPPSIGQIRKALLMFDHVTILDPENTHLVHKGEVVDKGDFHYQRLIRDKNTNPIDLKGSILGSTWNDTLYLPRKDYYNESILRLANGTEQSQPGALNIFNPRRSMRVNHVVNWHLFNALLRGEEYFWAAIPDRRALEKPSNDIIIDIDFEPRISNIVGGYSIFNVGEGKRFIPKEVDKSWVLLARGRLARFVKGHQLAYSLNSYPLVMDEVNAGIVQLINSRNLLNIDKKENSAIAVSLDVFDSEELFSALQTMTWKEYNSIRKHVLPEAKKFRNFFVSKALAVSKTTSSANFMFNEMNKLRGEFESRREEYAKCWEALRIVSVLKGGGSVGALALGSVALPPLFSWREIILALTGGSLIVTSAIASQMANYIKARSSFISHPLHFLEKLPNS